MAPTVTEERSDPHITQNDLKSSDSADDNLIISQLMKTPNTQPHVPHASSSYKRRKSKPIRFEASGTNVQKELPPPTKIVVSDPSSPPLSSQNEKSPTLGFKTPVPNSPAMIRAGEIQSSLGTEFPSCIKMMVKSQVSCGFWLGLPLSFCRSFLPKEDTTFILEDENGEQCEVKYIAYKSGISAGWKNFANGHKLIEGDVVIFHLIDSDKFKVYIVKASDPIEVNGALTLFNSEPQKEKITSVTPKSKPKRSRKRAGSLSLTMLKKRQKKSTPKPKPQHSGNDSSEVVSVSDLLEASKPEFPFQELKSFQDFHITVKGQCIDSELPEEVRLGYYKLCTDKKQFLHDNIPEALYYKLVAGMIGETVSIANEMRKCKLTTSKVEFEAWDNSLKSFEILGMKVGFLRDKIRRFERLVFECEDMKRYVEAKNEQKLIEDEIKKVEERLKELKKTARNFEGISGCLKEKAEKYINEFQGEVDAPW